MVMNHMIQFMKQLSGRLTPNVYTSYPEQPDPGQLAYLRQLHRDMNKKESLLTPFDQLPVVVFDLETTGFFPNKGDKILSIGAVKMVGDKLLADQTFYSAVHAEEMPSEELLQLIGLTPDKLTTAPPISTVLRGFYEFAQSDTLVAHHANHEKKFMQAANWSVFKTTFTHRLVDTSFLTRIMEPESPLHSLDDWCDYYGITIDNRHHALSDAMAAARLWGKGIGHLKERGFSNLSELYNYLATLT